MNHVVLLGDSIFDNATYSGAGRDVCSTLKNHLSADWKVTLLAVDGSTTVDISAQIKQIPVDTSHIVISAGGNDALGVMGLLDARVKTMTEALSMVATVIDGFRERYQTMLKAVLDRGHSTALSSIYYPRIPEPALQKVAVTALTFFNDVIISEAVQHGLPILDLRFICNEDADFANPIEPSAAGSAKIATAIQHLLLDHDFAKACTEIFI